MPTILPDIEEVIMIALSKDYRQRFGSVHAFAHALEQASQTTPLTCSTQMIRPTPSSAIATGNVISATSPISSSPADGPDVPQQAQTIISRRKVTLGLAGLFAASAGITWLAFPPASHSPNQAPCLRER